MNAEVKRLAVSIVQKISRKVRREMADQFFQMGKVVGIGADGSPTAFIDQIAEDVAIKVLKKSSVPVNLLSEECGFVDFGGKYVFVLDPVDGTRNACRGIPFYGVSLAVGYERLSDVEFGIVKNIPTSDEFIAVRGSGAFFNNKRIAACEVPGSDLVLSVLLGRHCTNQARAVIEKHNLRSMGSAALEMCLVGIGAIDLYYVDKDYLRVVDIAAASLVVREAGGIVQNRWGVELDMGLNLDERTSVVAAGSAEVIQAIVKKRKTPGHKE
ncbi:MAG: inositol monophosphatase [Candidatus Thermoplasmatota archaeon]|nr:inositol monophosphatase [Candidatus Thermoplasmatota archaeon]MBU1940572.1 inositol monophosphatase [Candidatus Thermoplasmatota archaeon]